MANRRADQVADGTLKRAPAKKAPAKKAAPRKATAKKNPLQPDQPGRPTRITPDLITLISAGVGAGMFPHVAARAAGVHRSLYARWMARGEAALALEADGQRIPASEAPYAEFCAVVGQEAARARGKAESRTAQENPAQWLRWGPGRERSPDEPGWTNAVTLQSPDGGPVPAAGPVVVRVEYVEDLIGGDE